MKAFAVLAALGSLLLLSPYLRAADASAEHGNDMVHVGRNISVGPNEAVGDAVCVGCSIHMAGRAGGDLVVVGGNVQVEGTVQGDATVVGGNLRLGPGAVVHGDVTTVGGRLERAPSAQVGGDITSPSLGSGTGLLALLLAPLICLLLVGVVLSVLCVAIFGERRIETIVSALRQHTGLGLLAGVGVLAGFVVLVAVFHWTGPLAPVVFIGLTVGLLVMAVLGYTAVSAWIGHGVAPTAGLMGAVVVGAVLVGVLQAVPVIGLLAAVIFGLFALGGAALSGLGSNPDWLSQRLSNRPPASSAGAVG